MSGGPPPEQELFRDIIVDDNDPGLVYSGDGWFLDNSGTLDGTGNNGAAFKHTLHGTNTGGSVSIQFTGTFIQALGQNSKDLIPPDSDEPIFQCFIDGVGAYIESEDRSPANQRLFCDSFYLNLTATAHTLTLEVRPSNVTFWFDMFQFTPLEDASIREATIFILQNDPVIQYDPSWVKGDGFAVTRETNSSMSLNFTGSSISWYGSVTPQLSNRPFSSAQYTIDGGPPNVFFWEQNENSSTENQEFFTSPGVEFGSHELKVTYLGSNETVPLLLNYLLINNGTLPLSIPLRPSEQTPNPTPTPNTNNTGPITSNTNPVDSTGAIIGGVLGSIAFLGCLVGILWVWRRRQKAQKPISPELIFEPFVLPPRFAPIRRETKSDDSPISGSDISQPTGAAGFIHHEDSGMRFSPAVELPPQYSPA